MNAPLWVISGVDIGGAIVMITIAGLAIREAYRLTRGHEREVLWTYLLWLTLFIGVFAISRSTGHLFAYFFFEMGYPEIWEAISPYSGAIHSFTFTAVAILTFFYGTVSKQNTLLQNEIVARKSAEKKLRRHRKNLETLVQQRTKTLREQQERYKSLFTSIRDAIIVADTNRHIINCNPALMDLFGYELEDLKSKHMSYVYASEEDYEAMSKAIEGHIGDPEFSHTVPYEKKSGQTFPGETSVFHLRNPDDEIVGYIGVIRDISDRLDRLTQLKIVDRVLQHNFHNHMNVILGFAENIEEEGTRSVSRYAETIKENGRDLLRTVDKEREITKFLSDPQPTKQINVPQRCRLVVEQIISKHAEATITTRFPEDATVEAVPAIERAIEELLTNSIIHADSDEPKVSLIVSSSADEVIVQVIDENPHIPEMERRILAGEEELSPLYHGSGMGLWLVQLIVKHSNGALEFGENDPKGNIVTIRFPVR